MSNHCHNTITITGPEAELRRFSAAHPLARGNDGPPCDFTAAVGSDRSIQIQKIADSPGHCFGWDVRRETTVTEYEDSPGLTLVLKYNSTTAWHSPLEEVKEASAAYPELQFDLDWSFGPGEGDWGHVLFQAGKYKGRCRGGHDFLGMAGLTVFYRDRGCPDNDKDRHEATIIYGHWWQHCETHKYRWCMGDYNRPFGQGKNTPSLAEQEEDFTLLGGEAGYPEESSHGYLSYADSYQDADLQSDRQYWRATIRDRRRILEKTPEGRTILKLSEEEIAKVVARLAEEEAYLAKCTAEAAEWDKANGITLPDDDAIPVLTVGL